jgi:hypothetical protein
MEDLEALFGKAGELVPAIDVEDLKKMWGHSRSCMRGILGNNTLSGSGSGNRSFPQAQTL